MAKKLSALEKRQQQHQAPTKTKDSMKTLTRTIRRVKARLDALKLVEHPHPQQQQPVVSPRAVALMTAPTSQSPRLIRTQTGMSLAKKAVPGAAGAPSPRGLSRMGTVISFKHRPISPDTVIVLDNGSSFMKAGVAGEEVPRVVVPTVTAYSGDLVFCGKSALSSPLLKPRCPLDPRSGPIDFDALEDLWEFVLERQLRIDPSSHPLVMSELPAMNVMTRRRAAEILFESFSTPDLCIRRPALLSLFSQGLTTGIALDLGNRMQIVPVVEGTELDVLEQKERAVVADLTGYLARLLTSSGYYFTSPKSLQLVRKLKEEACYVAADFESECKTKEALKTTFETTDGQTISISTERFTCPEAMFKPSLLGLDAPGIHELLWRAIERSPIDCRKELLSHVVLAGGSTLFPGFEQRLERELFGQAAAKRARLHQSEVRIISPGNRKYLAWIGGSMLGGTPRFLEQECVHSGDYFEKGEACIL